MQLQIKEKDKEKTYFSFPSRHEKDVTRQKNFSRKLQKRKEKKRKANELCRSASLASNPDLMIQAFQASPEISHIFALMALRPMI